MSRNKIVRLGDPTDPQDAANKKYVDNKLKSKVISFSPLKTGQTKNVNIGVSKSKVISLKILTATYTMARRATVTISPPDIDLEYVTLTTFESPYLKTLSFTIVWLDDTTLQLSGLKSGYLDVRNGSGAADDRYRLEKIKVIYYS